jgi:hypothetical protein
MALEVLITAFLGGAIRNALGIRKYNPRHGRIISTLSSGIIGALAGFSFITITPIQGDAALWAAGLAGYVAADVIEALYKLRLKRGGALT